MNEEHKNQFDACPIFDGNHVNYINFRDEILAWLQTTSTACLQMMGNRGHLKALLLFFLQQDLPESLLGHSSQDHSQEIAQFSLEEHQQQQ